MRVNVFWAAFRSFKPNVKTGHFPGTYIHSPGCVFCQSQSLLCAGSLHSGAAAELALSPAASARPRLSVCCSSEQRGDHKQCEQDELWLTFSYTAKMHPFILSLMLTSLSNSLTSFSKRLVAFLRKKKEFYYRVDQQGIELNLLFFYNYSM